MPSSPSRRRAASATAMALLLMATGFAPALVPGGQAPPAVPGVSTEVDADHLARLLERWRQGEATPEELAAGGTVQAKFEHAKHGAYALPDVPAVREGPAEAAAAAGLLRAVCALDAQDPAPALSERCALLESGLARKAETPSAARLPVNLVEVAADADGDVRPDAVRVLDPGAGALRPREVPQPYEGLALGWDEEARSYRVLPWDAPAADVRVGPNLDGDGVPDWVLAGGARWAPRPGPALRGGVALLVGAPEPLPGLRAYDPGAGRYVEVAPAESSGPAAGLGNADTPAPLPQAREEDPLSQAPAAPGSPDAAEDPLATARLTVVVNLTGTQSGVPNAMVNVSGKLNRTNIAGFASFRLRPGPAHIEVTKPGFRPASRDVVLLPLEERLVVVNLTFVGQPIPIEGQVLDAATGLPIAGAVVSVGAALRATTGPDGRYRLTLPNIGGYVLTASRPPAWLEQERRLEMSFWALEGFVSPVDFHLEPLRSELRMRVTGDGVPLDHVSVLLSADFPSGRLEKEVSLLEAGDEAIFLDLPPTQGIVPYDVRVTRPGWSPGTLVVHVGPGQQFPAGAAFRIDPDLAPLRSTIAGQLFIRQTGQPFNPRCEDFPVAGGPPGVTEVPVCIGFVAKLRGLDPWNQPGARGAPRDHTARARVVLAGDGEYRFDDLPPGRYAVEVTLPVVPGPRHSWEALMGQLAGAGYAAEVDEVPPAPGPLGVLSPRASTILSNHVLGERVLVARYEVEVGEGSERAFDPVLELPGVDVSVYVLGLARLELPPISMWVSYGSSLRPVTGMPHEGDTAPMVGALVELPRATFLDGDPLPLAAPLGAITLLGGRATFEGLWAGGAYDIRVKGQPADEWFVFGSKPDADPRFYKDPHNWFFEPEQSAASYDPKLLVGESATGAVVTLHASHSRLAAMVTHAPPLAGPVEGATVSIAGLSAKTGPDGSAVIEKVPYGRWTLQASKQGYASTDVPADVLGNFGDARVWGDLVLAPSPSASLSGTVREVSAHLEFDPITFEITHAECHDEPFAVAVVLTHEDGMAVAVPTSPATGSYAFENLPPGRYLLAIGGLVWEKVLAGGTSNAHDTAFYHNAAPLVTCGENPDSEVLWASVSAKVRGRLVDAETLLPVKDARLTFTSPVPAYVDPEPVVQEGPTGARSATSDEDGRFQVTWPTRSQVHGLEGFNHVVDVTTVLNVTHPSYGAQAPVDLRLDFSTTVLLELERSANFTGAVVHAETGAPMSEVRVSMEPVGHERHRSSQLTGPDGRFRFANVQPGAYQVTFSKEGFLPVVLDVTLLRGETDDGLLLHPLALRPLPKPKVVEVRNPFQEQVGGGLVSVLGGASLVTRWTARVQPAPAAAFAPPITQDPVRSVLFEFIENTSLATFNFSAKASGDGLAEVSVGTDALPPGAYKLRVTALTSLGAKSDPWNSTAPALVIKKPPGWVEFLLQVFAGQQTLNITSSEIFSVKVTIKPKYSPDALKLTFNGTLELKLDKDLKPLKPKLNGSIEASLSVEITMDAKGIRVSTFSFQGQAKFGIKDIGDILDEFTVKGSLTTELKFDGLSIKEATKSFSIAGEASLRGLAVATKLVPPVEALVQTLSTIPWGEAIVEFLHKALRLVITLGLNGKTVLTSLLDAIVFPWPSPLFGLKCQEFEPFVGIVFKLSFQVGPVKVNVSGGLQKASLTVGLPPTPFFKKAQLVFGAGLSLRAWMFSAEPDLLKWTLTWNWVEEGAEPCTKKTGATGPSGVTSPLDAMPFTSPGPRPYWAPIARPWAGGGQFVWQPGQDSGIVAHEVFDDAAPALATGPSGTHLVWVHDNASFPLPKGLELRWSRWDPANRSWSTPAPVVPRNFLNPAANFGAQAPALASDALGRVVAVWPAAVNLTLPDEYNPLFHPEDAELLSSVWVPALRRWSSPARVTTNLRAEQSPDLAASGPAVLAAWASPDPLDPWAGTQDVAASLGDLDVLGLPGPGQLAPSLGWTPAVTVAKGIALRGRPAAALGLPYAAVAWVEEPGEVRYSVLRGTWSPPASIAASAGAEQVDALIAGDRLHLLWAERGNDGEGRIRAAEIPLNLTSALGVHPLASPKVREVAAAASPGRVQLAGNATRLLAAWDDSDGARSRVFTSSLIGGAWGPAVERGAGAPGPLGSWSIAADAAGVLLAGVTGPAALGASGPYDVWFETGKDESLGPGQPVSPAGEGVALRLAGGLPPAGWQGLEEAAAAAPVWRGWGFAEGFPELFAVGVGPSMPHPAPTLPPAWPWTRSARRRTAARMRRTTAACAPVPTTNPRYARPRSPGNAAWVAAATLAAPAAGSTRNASS